MNDGVAPGAEGQNPVTSAIGDAITFGPSRYVLGTAGLTWEQANAEAQSLGGRIVEINSAEEDAFIFETFGGDSAPIWLGFSDQAVEGTFVGSDGATIGYSNWLPGEPNNYGGNQDYAIMSSSTGQWDDAGNTGGWYFDAGWSGGHTNRLVIEFALETPDPDPQPDPQPPVEAPIYVIAGQSNALGLGEYYSLEVALEALNLEGTIVKTYEGGTALAPIVNHPWAPAHDWHPVEDGNPATGEMFARLVSEMDAALAASPESRLKGFLWVQGETDAYLAASTDQYAQQLETFVTTLHARYGTDFIFTIVQLADQMPEAQKAGAGWTRIMDAQAQVAAKFDTVTLIDPDEVIAAAGHNFADVLYDQVHYSYVATNEIAKAFAAQFVQDADPAPEPHPEPQPDPVPDAPALVASDDVGTMNIADRDTGEINILSNDTGEGLSVTRVGTFGASSEGAYWVAGDTGGHFWINTLGQAWFFDEGAFDDLGAGQTATSSVEYVITNAAGETDTATLSVAISSPKAGFAVDDTAAMRTWQDSTEEVRLLANDTGDGLSVTRVGNVTGIGADGGYWAAGDAGGHFWINPQGQAWFFDEGAFDDLGIGETATSSVTYEVTNAAGGTDRATIAVEITGAAPYTDGDPTVIENPEKIGFGLWDGQWGDLSHAAYFDQLDHSWYYTWWTNPIPSEADVEFTPMIWGDYITPELLAEAVQSSTSGALLGFNEPDHVDQSDMTVERAVELWSELESTGLRLGSPATAHWDWNDDSWFSRFMTQAEEQDLRIDFIALHTYTSNPDVSALKNYLVSVYEKYEKPIWITEYGLVDWGDQDRFSPEQTANYMTDVFLMLDDLTFVEKHAWWGALPGGDGFDLPTDFIDYDGNTTAVGDAYWDLIG